MKRLKGGALGLALVVAACSGGEADHATSATSTSTTDATVTTRTGSPATSFGDGVFKVNVNVRPGIYAVRNVTDGCHWRTADAAGRTIAEKSVDIAPRVQATISSTAVTFESDHCGTWHRVP